jgi:hypothetical protein
MNDFAYSLIYSVDKLSMVDGSEVEVYNQAEKYFANIVFSMLVQATQTTGNYEESYRQVVSVRKGLLDVLNSFAKGIERSFKDFDKLKKSFVEFERFKNEEFPEYVKFYHPKAAISFFKKLKKEDYTYVEAGRLIGKSRQTISQYKRKGSNGFFKGGRKVSKKDIYLNYLNTKCDSIQYEVTFPIEEYLTRRRLKK